MLKRGLLALCLAASGPAAGGQTITWAPSLAAAKQQAKESGRPTVVHESFDNCSACTRYQNAVYASPAVQALAPRFVWLRLKPPGPGGAPPELPGGDRVDHPLVRFVTPDWKTEIHHTTAPFPKPQAFAAMLESVLYVVEAEAAVARDRNSVEAWYALGAGYLAFEPPSYERALKPLQQVVKLDPTDAAGHLEQASLDLAIATLQTGGEKQAVRMLGDFVQTYPESTRLAEALYYQAAGLAATGDVAGAQKVLGVIQDTEPPGSRWSDLAEEMTTRLQITVWRKRLPLAAEAPDLPPPTYTEEEVELLFQLGHGCTKVRYHNWALQYLRQYLTYDPGNVLGHHDDAYLDVAISLVPGAPQMAILRLQEYARQHPTTPRMDELVLALGLAYFALGDANLAKGHCRQVVDRFPDTRSARTAKQLLGEIETMAARGPGEATGLPDWLRGEGPMLPP